MTAAFALAITILMFLVCEGLARYARYDAERHADSLLAASARQISEVALSPMVGSKERKQQVNLSELEEEGREQKADNIAVMALDDGGRVIWRSNLKGPSWPRNPNDGWRTMNVRIGDDTLVVGLPWRETEVALKNQEIVLFVLSGFVLVVSASGAWWLVGRTLSPIGSLSHQAREATADSLNVHLDAPSLDLEVVELVSTLNGLLERVSETAASKGRFYAAASHELRTPLQALSGHLEVALDRPRTDIEYRAAVEEALKQTRRLISLVRDLLLLTQLDSSGILPPRDTVNLTEISERILSRVQPLIEERRLQVSDNLCANIEIAAPISHVEMLVRNLIENAVKYALPGGEVRVEALSYSNGTKMNIYNEYRSLEKLNTERLFEPFFRADASRNSDTGGNGLGLAICRAIANANGWTLSLEQHDDGVEVTVFFGRETVDGA